MITRQELEGHWNQVKGRLQERWGVLTDSELQEAKGSANQLVGMVQERTGESRRTVEEFLDSIIEEGRSTMQHAAESVRERASQVAEGAREYADKASAAAREQYEQVSAQLGEGYQQAQEMVRRKPMESVATAFGAGIITGVLLGLIFKSR